MTITALAETLTAERNRLGLSQEHVAILIGVAPCTVTMWEKGHRQPGLGHAEKWAAVLGYSLGLIKTKRRRTT